MKAPVYLVLLHYPMLNKRGETITTAVTNLDIHDISRSARTYCVNTFFIVTPILEQHEIVNRILGHWREERAQKAHPDRVEAVNRVKLVRDFDEVLSEISAENTEGPEVFMPDARTLKGSIGYKELRQELEESDRTRPLVIVLGTGWGIAEEFFPRVDRFLNPILGPEGRQDEGGYNHLSVRAAAAIILDRLFGN